MLISDWVRVKWHNRNKNHFESKGYIYTKIGDEFLAKVENLNKGSHVRIIIQCDYCGKLIDKEYKDYLIQNEKSIIHKDCCEKCKGKKIKESNNIVYGVDVVTKLEEVQQKSKDTCLKKYGYERAAQSPEIIEKTKQSNNIKYGVDNPFQLEEIKEKIKQKIVEKYGVENYTQTEEYKVKSKNTCLVKYGFEYAFQSEEIKEKIKQTSLKNYGTEHPFQNNEFKKKFKQIMINKYGVSHYSQTDEYKVKFKQTSLKNWGTEHPMQNLIIQEKVRKTLYNNNNISTSTQQLYIYNLLKDNGYNVELNYPLSKINLDVALFISVFKIDIEYDAWYWHQNQQKDRRRDEFSKSQGWKILRIKSGILLPTLEQLKYSIEKLINSSRTFTSIILNDWKIVS